MSAGGWDVDRCESAGVGAGVYTDVGVSIGGLD